MSKNTNDIAEAYLKNERGLDLTFIEGLYKQDICLVDRKTPQEKNINTATFWIDTKDGRQYWDRLIDGVMKNGGKARFRAGSKWSGYWWQRPQDQLHKTEKIYICEGIFDAIALNMHGYAAVSIMSSGFFPEQALLDLAAKCEKEGIKRPVLVWALDNDKAGKDCTQKHVKHLRDDEETFGRWKQECILPPIKKDWNDLHKEKKLNKNAMQGYAENGELLIAKNAAEKASLLSKKYKGKVLFDFDNCIFEVNVKEANDFVLSSVSNFVFEFVTFTKKPNNDSIYTLKLSYEDGSSQIEEFSARELGEAKFFGTKIIAINPLGLWLGDTKQLKIWCNRSAKNIKHITEINYCGYVEDINTYVFPEVAIRNGKILEIDQETSAFKIGADYFKTTTKNPKIKLNEKFSKINQEDFTAKHWLRFFYNAFGEDGIIVLGFWMGSLFAEQIRAKQESFPFLEIAGEAGSGKTTMLKFLWKLFGFDNQEGADFKKYTPNARARLMSQSVNLPIVCIESDHGGGRRDFDYDQFKDYYNGYGETARSPKDHSNNIELLKFKGSLIFAHNNKISGSEPFLQRLICLPSNKKHHNEKSRKAAELLENLSAKDVQAFIFTCLTKQEEILKCYFSAFASYDKELRQNPKITNNRVQKNYAQIMALIACLTLVLQDDEIYNSANNEADYLIAEKLIVEGVIKAQQLAENHQIIINQDDALIEEFWEMYYYLTEMLTSNPNDYNPKYIKLNHYPDEAPEIAINLTEFISHAAADAKNNSFKHKQLKTALKQSKTYVFVCEKRINKSVINGGRPRCMIFTKPTEQQKEESVLEVTNEEIELNNF